MSSPDPYADFRLDPDEQQQRAEELLKAWRDGDATALQRCADALGVDAPSPADAKLAHAQQCLARELRFSHWAALKQHCEALQAARAALTSPEALDADCRTLHIRCGHDIQHTLQRAGLHGDFCVQIDPYVQGPVTQDADWLQQRARFICDAAVSDAPLQFDNVLADCHAAEQQLERARTDYARVVLWFELDAYDQLILIRCLAHFAEHGLPARLELVDAADFPGARQFLGLGQLPPEALRLLWAKRRVLQRAHAALAAETWHAYRCDDPRALARLAASGTPLLPTLAPALRRQLQELPCTTTQLSLTQHTLLATLVRLGTVPVAQLLGETLRLRDALSGIGDWGLDYELRQLALAKEAVLHREVHGSLRRDLISATPLAEAVLRGERRWLSLQPAPRWVGGVCIKPGQRNWHWDAQRAQVVSL